MVKIKKIISFILSFVLLFTLVACGGDQTAEEPSSNVEEQVESNESKPEEKTINEETAEEVTDFPSGRVIGKNTFLPGAYAHDIMTRVAKVMIDGTGDSIKEFTDDGDILNLLNDVENMVNSNVDGALWWGVMDSNYAVGPRQYENANIPFAFFDCVPQDEEIVSDIQNMEYYSGSASCNNALMGEQMGRKAVEDGCKVAIVFANEIGSPLADRANYFKKVFEDAGGKVVEISHAGTAANAHVEAAANMLAAHTDVDCVYAVGVDLAVGVYSVIEQMPDRDIKLYATDITPDSLNYLVEGAFDGLNGGHWGALYFATALLLNNMDGHKIVEEDGTAADFLIEPIVVTPKTADLYKKFWIDELPYSYENLKHLLYRNNPDVTYEDFKEAVENYTMEGVLKIKLEEGKVTEEELKEAGIDIK